MTRALMILLLALSTSGCVTAAEPTVNQMITDAAARQQARLAELEPQYGKCIMDGWRSHSVIGKTTSKELIRHMRACDHRDWDVSNYVSANRRHTFVHLGHRTWHFINGVLVSYRT